MARLARLSRMARMARLLRAMPELMILIKGIVAATRSVFFTLLLLCLLLYVFAIAFTQLTVDTQVGQLFFPSVPASMYTLLVFGTLADGIGTPLKELLKMHWFYAGMYLMFVLFATMTVMNMLIGVLCEVVCTVASVERETRAVAFVKSKLGDVLKNMDEDGSGTISKEEFATVLDSEELVRALNQVGVDVEGLAELVEVIFSDEEDIGQSRELTFSELMAKVLQMRGSNKITVKDVVEFHKFVKQRMQATSDELRELIDILPTLRSLLQHPDTKQVILRPTGKRHGTTHQLLVIRKSDAKGLPRMLEQTDLSHGIASELQPCESEFRNEDELVTLPRNLFENLVANSQPHPSKLSGGLAEWLEHDERRPPLSELNAGTAEARAAQPEPEDLPLPVAFSFVSTPRGPASRPSGFSLASSPQGLRALHGVDGGHSPCCDSSDLATMVPPRAG